jgi:hypothetical protein
MRKILGNSIGHNLNTTKSLNLQILCAQFVQLVN